MSKIDRATTSVVAIDPGETFGVAWQRPGPDGVVELKSWQDDADEVLSWLKYAISQDVIERIVIERFDPRRWDEHAVRTVEYIGVIRWLARTGGAEWKRVIPIGEVNASDKKKTLRDVPEWVQRPHAHDAEAIRLWDLRYGRW